MTYEASRKIEINTWDRHVVPMPFSRCTINFGDPIFIPRDAAAAFIAEKNLEVESALQRLTQEAGEA